MNSQRLESIVAELLKPIGDIRRSFDTDLSAVSAPASGAAAQDPQAAAIPYVESNITTACLTVCCFIKHWNVDSISPWVIICCDAPLTT